jgi:hypothetical protein
VIDCFCACRKECVRKQKYNNKTHKKNTQHHEPSIPAYFFSRAEKNNSLDKFDKISNMTAAPDKLKPRSHC